MLRKLEFCSQFLDSTWSHVAGDVSYSAVAVASWDCIVDLGAPASLRVGDLEEDQTVDEHRYISDREKVHNHDKNWLPHDCHSYRMQWTSWKCLGTPLGFQQGSCLAGCQLFLLVIELTFDIWGNQVAIGYRQWSPDTSYRMYANKANTLLCVLYYHMAQNKLSTSKIHLWYLLSSSLTRARPPCWVSEFCSTSSSRCGNAEVTEVKSDRF